MPAWVLARRVCRLLACIAVLVAVWRPHGNLAALGATPFVAPEPPSVTAAAAYVVDATVGTELYALNADEPRPPASLTKVVTALVVLRQADLDDRVTIEQGDLVDENQSQVGLLAGDTLTVRDLLHGLLIQSGNDSANALARQVGASLPGGDPAGGGDPSAAFVAEMNALAASLGLANTHFTNPSGLDDPEHLASARDLVALTARAMDDPTFAEIVATPTAVLSSELRPEGYTVNTTNDLLLEGAVQGVKTGTTGEAGGCLISAASFGPNRVIAVVLGSATELDEEGNLKSPARFADTRTILAAIPNDYRWLDPTVPGEVAGLAEELAVWQTTLEAGPALVLPAARAEELRYRLQLGPEGPPNTEVGKVLFFVGSDLLSERPVFQAAASGPAGVGPAVTGGLATTASRP